MVARDPSANIRDVTGALLAARAAAALICLDPGHGTPPAIGAQKERIGPGSSVLKIKDGGGTAGEAPVARALPQRTRAPLLGRGSPVPMTRTRPPLQHPDRGDNAPGRVSQATP